MPQPARFLPRRAVRAVLPLRLSNRNPRAHFLCEHQIFSLTARQFTTTRHRDAAMGGLRDVNYNSVMPKVHSSKTQMAKQTAGKERSMPDDLGRMPNSLVMAPSSNLPSWLPPTSSRRLRLKWFQLKTAVQSWFSIFYLLYWDAPKDPVTNKKIRKPLELSERATIAKGLHQQFNRALAAGDTATLEKIACDGVLAKAKSRIQRRKRVGAIEQWKHMKYLGIDYPQWLQRWPISVLLPNASARVLTDRMAPLPFPKSSFRQCTVRISSCQWCKTASMQYGQIFNRTEYVVIQKLEINGKEGDWKFWGTVDPNTMEEIDKMMEGQKGQDTLAARFREQLSTVTGGFGGMSG
ncbi:hypothetical protein PV05_03392 [Exophiala xenobiotica]|uniref:Tim44-like domain-containing protein n=1 Tax=Exophiala xenobiotica TaxID=348802 RepID=A0A0D2ET31_9EURO|nr:uncharacterized protein PV05_03392 [Exophiala xenobiotica]KIW58898.1 hypothetical protein PV05_03392 [Exophiala xenobiotica]